MEDNDYMAALGAKIALLGKELGQVKEDAKNDFSKYNYISGNQMAALIRDSLPKYFLAIVPEIYDYSETMSTNDKNKQVIRTVVKVQFTIIDTETGFSMVQKWIGADQDTGGKSFGQAVTEATKRFYLKLFNVSSKEDIDPDSKTTEVELDSLKNMQLKQDFSKMKSHMSPEEVEGVKIAINANNWVDAQNWHDSIHERL